LIVATSELSPVSYGRFVDTVARLVMQSKGREAVRFADDPSLLADVDAIVREMKSHARATPRRLDELFARLNRAWIRGEHATYSAGVGAIAEALYGGVDLGQDELYIEVLETDFTEVGRRYLVSVYLTTPPEQRAAALHRACLALGVFECCELAPIAAMEASALEPLPALDAFAPAWAAHLRHALTGHLRAPSIVQRQLQEATLRSDGTAGLAALARASEKREDYEAWIGALLADEERAEAAAAAREGAAAVEWSHDRASLHTFAARIELLRGKSAADDLHAALIAQPNDFRFRQWLGALPTSRRADAVATAELASDDASLVATLAALRGDWPRIASLLEGRRKAATVPSRHDVDAAAQGAIWALTRGDATKIARPTKARRLADPAALEEHVARVSPELHAPPLLELLSELKPPAPSSRQAKALRDGLAHAALALVEAVASRPHRSRYDDAAAFVALAAAVHADAGDHETASDVVSRARDIAGRKWTLTRAIDAAVEKSAADPADSVENSAADPADSVEASKRTAAN
jgi:hypothetical protein